MLVFGSAIVLSLLSACAEPSNTGSAGQAGKTDQPPNIIVILADDLGYGDLGCYGQQQIQTPQIDKMATEGMRFTSFYAGATVCAPSRAALLTGRHNGHATVRGNQPFPQQLGNEPTIASLLQNAGYATALIGKWGVGHPQPVGDPQRVGFQYSYGYLNMWHAHNFYPEFLWEDSQKVALRNQLLPKNQWENNSFVTDDPTYQPDGYGQAAVKLDYVPDLTEQKAIEFIDRNKEKPFFLFYTTTIPHANNEIKSNGMEVPDYGAYAGKDWPEVEKGFAAAISRLDATVGKILAHLRQQGLDSNTLVIFTSDNGPHEEGGHSAQFFGSSGPYRGTKRDLYEGGLRVPMIAWWPGRVAAGGTEARSFAQYDYLATFCEAAGISIPDGTDGVSLLPTLTGKGEQRLHDYLYWEFYEAGGRQSVLQYPWKLVKLNTTTFRKSGSYELYNLDTDPAEKDNKLNTQAAKADALKKLMEQAHVPHPQLDINKPRPGMAGKT